MKIGKTFKITEVSKEKSQLECNVLGNEGPEDEKENLKSLESY